MLGLGKLWRHVTPRFEPPQALHWDAAQINIGAPQIQTIAAQLARPEAPNAYTRIDAARLRLAVATASHKILHAFVPLSFASVPASHRQAALRPRTPADAFDRLFFLCLPRHNWDSRIPELDVLIPAYPAGKKPFPFQLAGVGFLSERNSALLADEMGLGKTIQAILALRARIHAGHAAHAIVVCPKSLMRNWEHELSIWAPELSVQIAHGKDKVEELASPHHVDITNYETVVNTIAPVPSRFPYDLLVVDEIQNLKNPATQRARAVRDLHVPLRWGLTGTPLENKFTDYASVWSVLDPDAGFLRQQPDQIMAATKPHSLRREKAAVLQDLPAQIEELVRLDLEPAQRRRYEHLERTACDEARVELEKHAAAPRQAQMNILALINRLKQVCVIDDVSGESAKMLWLQERLEEMHPESVPQAACEKALIFTQYPQLAWERWKLPQWLEPFHPLRYDGSLDEAARQEFIRRLQTDESRRVAFIGMQAGGTGLNLQRASQVIFLDSWWNPAMMSQAAGRVHRIGQSRTCYVTTLIARHTIEERILRILDRKRTLFESIMVEIRAGKKTAAALEAMDQALTLDDLLEALGMEKPPAGAR